MRGGTIGLVIGAVVGIVVGATVVAPHTQPRSPPAASEEPAAKEGPSAAPAEPEPPPTPAQPGARQLRMVSVYPFALPQVGGLAKRLDQTLWRVSGGFLGLKPHEPGSLVAPEELLDALAAGKVDAVFASPAEWGARAPALRIFGGLPFGPDAPELLAWHEEGGGRKLHDNAFAAQKLRALPCGLMGAEGAGWARRPIRSLADMQGLRIAVEGLPAKVLARIGAEPRALRGAAIFLALEANEIDAVGFSSPAVDAKAGFRRLLRHYHFPPWHRAAGFLDLVVGQGTWDALSANARLQLEVVCGDNLRRALAEGEAAQFAALKELQVAKVKLHRWPPEVLEALRKAWVQVVTEETGSDALFRETWDSLGKFRENYAIWRELREVPGP